LKLIPANLANKPATLTEESVKIAVLL